MRSFIIHLPGDARRRPNADRLAATLPGARIVDAVRGADVMAVTDLRPGDLHAPAYPYPMSAGEVGCFLSHRACWQRIVDEGLDHALIVEDDAAFDPALWPHVRALIAAQARTDRYIRLPAKRRERPGLVIAQDGPAQLFLPRIIGLQTVAQVVGRDAAQRLLSATRAIDRPVDTLLQMHWATGQPVHTIWPSGVTEITAEVGGSTIQTKPRAGSKLAREWTRLVYRARIARRPQSAAGP